MAQCSQCKKEVGCSCNLSTNKQGQNVCSSCLQKELDKTPNDQILTPQQQATTNAR